MVVWPSLMVLCTLPPLFLPVLLRVMVNDRLVPAVPSVPRAVLWGAQIRTGTSGHVRITRPYEELMKHCQDRYARGAKRSSA